MQRLARAITAHRESESLGLGSTLRRPQHQLNRVFEAFCSGAVFVCCANPSISYVRKLHRRIRMQDRGVHSSPAHSASQWIDGHCLPVFGGRRC